MRRLTAVWKKRMRKIGERDSNPGPRPCQMEQVSPSQLQRMPPLVLRSCAPLGGRRPCARSSRWHCLCCPQGRRLPQREALPADAASSHRQWWFAGSLCKLRTGSRNPQVDRCVWIFFQRSLPVSEMKNLYIFLENKFEKHIPTKEHQTIRCFGN